MNKFLSLLGSLSILVISQSFATDVEASSTTEQAKVDLSGISKDQLKNSNELAKVLEALRHFVLQKTRHLAELQYYEDRALTKDRIYFDLKEMLIQRSVVMLMHLENLSNLYKDLQNKKKSATPIYLHETILDIEANADKLYRSISSLKLLADLIDTSVPEGFLVFHEELQQVQKEMISHFGGLSLAEIARTVLQKAGKDGENTLAEKLENRAFYPELSSLFGKFFLPLKTFKQDIASELENCTQSILQGKNVLDKLAEIAMRKIDPEFMREKYLKMAAHAGQMLLPLYYIESYEQNASTFSCQKADIDSYFDNVKKYVENAYQFKILLNSCKNDRQAREKDETGSHLKNFFVIIDPKGTFDRKDEAFKNWLQTFNFTFDLRGVFNVNFEQIDTNDAKMTVAAEKIENKKIYHNV